MSICRTTVAVGLIVAMPLIVGQGCGDMVPDDPNTHTVQMRRIAFDPPSLTIEAGQTVRWVNQDFVPHTATSGDPGDSDAGDLFDSGTLTRGQSFEHTFNEPGTFVYHCEFHPTTMRDAVVIVQ